MRIFIPSLSRATHQQQTTLSFLAAIGIRPTFVVRYDQVDEYAKFSNVADVVGCESKTIGQNRDFTVRELSDGENITIIDDDLQFFVRRDDDRTKFREGTKAEFQEMFERVDDLLNDFPLVGIASREGGNRTVTNTIVNTRIMRMSAYNPHVLLKHDIRFSDMEVMEDFHVALALLTRGYPNIVLNNYCHNQTGSNTKGGCSEFRTMEVQARSAHLLKEKYPAFVTVVTKETKTAWGGGTRTDVKIQWKKAWESGTGFEKSQLG